MNVGFGYKRPQTLSGAARVLGGLKSERLPCTINAPMSPIWGTSYIMIDSSLNRSGILPSQRSQLTILLCQNASPAASLAKIASRCDTRDGKGSTFDHRGHVFACGPRNYLNCVRYTLALREESLDQESYPPLDLADLF